MSYYHSFLIDEESTLSEEDIVYKYLSWSDDKADRFSKQEIMQGIETLLQVNVIEKKLVGYNIMKDKTISE